MLESMANGVSAPKS